jgi:hypothetical protein
MAKSELVQALDQIQSGLGQVLKSRKYKAKGRAFNFLTPDGLTNVINIQMGSFDPPGTTYIDGLTRNLYGNFTINCGVFVPEIFEVTNIKPPPSFIPEHSCCLRARLGKLGPEGTDLWWDITENSKMIDQLAVRIERDALPFFARFQSRDAILAELRKETKTSYVGTPPRIICAIIFARCGKQEEARELLALQALETRNPGHPAYVRKLADRLEISLSN